MNVRDEVCGKVYYFCADRCRRLFQEHPHWYVPIEETPGDQGA